MQLCLFASTPDIADRGFIVKVLTGTPDELCERAVAWGYDGIEFMPDPRDVLEPALMQRALSRTGAAMPVVNSGRMGLEGMALLDPDPEARSRSIDAFKRMIDFAAHFGSRVGLGIARGRSKAPDSLAQDVFGALASHAERAGVVVMLEPADPNSVSYVTTVAEAMAWVRRIASPGFSVMLDTYQLVEAERSIEEGIRAARGEARHIHLYDPSRWPPGVLPDTRRLDWPLILRVLREQRFEGSGSVVVAPEGDPEPAARKSVRFLRELFDGREGDQA